MANKRTVSLGEAFALFLVDRKARGHTPGTLRFYQDKVGLFVRWCEARGATQLHELSPALLRAYFVALIDRGNNENTRNGAGRALRTFCRWALADGLLTSSPLENVVIPRSPRKILPSFTPEDVKKLYTAAADARARALLFFLLDTGVRVQECMRLNGGDVNLKSGEVIVRQGKGRKDRTVYLGAKSRRALIAYFGEAGWPEATEALWRNERNDERLTDSGIRRLLRVIGDDAGVKHCHPHTFRRTFALTCLRGGMNVYSLARLMGHSDIAVLRPYLALVDMDLQAAHAAASPVDRMQ